MLTGMVAIGEESGALPELLDKVAEFYEEDVDPLAKSLGSTLEPIMLVGLASIVGLAYEGGTPFQAEVYFINLAQIIQVKFGVPFFDVYDPRFEDFGVPVAVRGTISFKIKDYREFVKLHRLNNFNLDDFQKQIRDAVTRYVKDTVANAPATNNIPLVQIETKTAQINDIIEFDIGERLKENFGVDVSGVDLAAIEIDKSSDGYRQLMSVTKDIAAATAQAEAAAKIKDIADKTEVSINTALGRMRYGILNLRKMMTKYNIVLTR